MENFQYYLEIDKRVHACMRNSRLKKKRLIRQVTRKCIYVFLHVYHTRHSLKSGAFSHYLYTKLELFVKAVTIMVTLFILHTIHFSYI